MGYTEKLHALREKQDVKGALLLLESIFTAEANQKIRGKATDYLHSDDEDETTPPAQGYRQILEGFQPRMSTEEKVTWIQERMEDYANEEKDTLDQMFRPFNGIRFRIGDYERCDAIADSGHYDPETRGFYRLYGLNHDIIFDADSQEDYDFVYELEEGDQYGFTFEGEELSGKQLYYDLKVTIFTRHLLEIIDRLKESPWFADKPKALPFYFLIQSAEYRKPEWHHEICRLTEEALDNPLRARFLASSERKAKPTPEQEFRFLVGYADKTEAPEFDQLVRHCADHRASFRKLEDLAGKALENRDGGGVGVLSRVQWALAPAYGDEVVEFHNQVFAQELPSFQPGDEYEERDPLRAAIAKVDDYVGMLTRSFAGIPDDFKARMQPAQEAAWKRLDESNHPVVRVMACEARLSPDELERVDYHGDFPRDPSDAYARAVTDCLDLFPEKHTGYGGGWDFVMNRLEHLGGRAAAAIPKVNAIMERYCSDRVDEQMISMLGKVLYQLGMEEVPELVHKVYHANQFMFEYFKDWAEKAPRRQLRHFDRAWEKDAGAFGQPGAWEEHLHDSAAGYQMFVERIQGAEGMLEAVMQAAGRGPGQKLSGLLCALSARAHKEKSYAQVVRFLSPIPEPDAQRAEDLTYARLAVLLGRMLEGDEVAGEFEKLLGEHPQNPALLYLDVANRLKIAGPAEAVERLIGHMKTLTADDLVYRKGFHLYARDESESFRPQPGNAYAIFRIAQEYFDKQNLSDGKFDGVTKRFKKDPFYAAFYSVIGEMSDEELDRELEGYRGEYEFLTTSGDLSDEELLTRLDPGSWHISRMIVERLAGKANPDHAGPLVGFFDQVAEDQDRARPVSFLLWPYDEFRETLLHSERFQAFLPAFIRKYPVRNDTLIRQVVDELIAQDLTEAVTRLAFELDERSVVATFKSFLNAFIMLADFKGAQRLLTKILGAMSEKKPEYTLVMSNLAVMHVQAGEMKEAEEVFDRLFAMDFSRFEYHEKDRDDMMDEIIGGNVEEQLAEAFQTYFRMARFNQACLFALTDRPDQAMASLVEAVARGHYTADRILAESDFSSLHGRDDFQEMVGGLMEKEESP